MRYFIERDNETKEIVYMEYDLKDGYKVNPKINKEDAIEVSKIVFVNPSLSEKIIRKKVDLQIKHLLDTAFNLDINDGDDGDNSGTKRCLMDAERLKLKLINDYVKYLGNTYASLSIKKIQLIIDALRTRLIDFNKQKNVMLDFDRSMNVNEENRGRKGR